jgi:hypothetical protein
VSAEAYIRVDLRVDNSMRYLSLLDGDRRPSSSKFVDAKEVPQRSKPTTGTAAGVDAAQMAGPSPKLAGRRGVPRHSGADEDDHFWSIKSKQVNSPAYAELADRGPAVPEL